MYYFDLIFTLHAQKQLKERGIKIAEAWETLKNPTKSAPGKKDGHEFEKEYDGYKITVVAVRNPKDEWVVKSVWRNPPLEGTKDAQEKKLWKKYNKSKFWGKLILDVRKQLGI